MDNESALAQMRKAYGDHVTLSDAEWDTILPSMQTIEVPKKHQLQKAGEPSTTHYFLVEGLVRYYYLGLDGKEHNKAFYDKGHIVASLSAIILNEPARYYIETIEPSTLATLPHVMNSGAWKELFNHGCQLMLIRNERREAELLTMTAKERFLQFHRNFPSYLDRIPQYHIASYLGITPVALSRFKVEWLKDQSTKS